MCMQLLNVYFDWSSSIIWILYIYYIALVIDEGNTILTEISIKVYSSWCLGWSKFNLYTSIKVDPTLYDA